MNVVSTVLPLKEIEILDKRAMFKSLLNSDLNFEEKRSMINPRHFWHSFPAKFPPGLPRIFVDRLTTTNQVVLDPMAGSCTTLLESEILNRQSFGFDIDPLSLIVGKAKLQNVSLESVKETGIQIIKKAKKQFDSHSTQLKKNLVLRFDEETQVFLDYWFLKETQLELLSLICEIEKIQDTTLQDFYRMLFSSIIITKSGGVTMGFDLAHTRPHKVQEKIPNSSFDEFHKRINKLTSTNGSIGNFTTRVVLQEANAKHLPIPDNSVDLIITSPPYANNAIDYMRAHKFSLVWFGYKISELKKVRKEYVGSENFIESYVTELPYYVTTIVEKLTAKDKSKGKSLLRYYSEMKHVIQEMYRVLKPNSACVIVVATSVLKGIDVETHIGLSEIGKKIGFELIDIGARTISRNSRMLPTSRIVTNSQIESRMHKEFVIGFYKN